MQALTGRGPVPAGFDGEAIREEARILISKRRRYVYRSRPSAGAGARTALQAALRRLCGRLPEARARSRGRKPVRALGGGAAGRRPYAGADRLARRAPIASRRVEVGGRATATRGDGRGSETTGAHARGARSLRGPGITEEPVLRTPLLLASLEVLGIELAPSRSAPLRSALEEIPAPRAAETSTGGSHRDTADEPCHRAHAGAPPRLRRAAEVPGVHGGRSVLRAGRSHVDDTRRRRRLDRLESRRALGVAIHAFVHGRDERGGYERETPRGGGAVQDPASRLRGRRALRLEMASRVAQLQLDAELELGDHASLTPRERESVRSMRGRVVLTLAPVVGGDGEPGSWT